MTAPSSSPRNQPIKAQYVRAYKAHYRQEENAELPLLGQQIGQDFWCYKIFGALLNLPNHLDACLIHSRDIKLIL